MSLPSLRQLHMETAKPNAAFGNWMARRVARPLALPITRWLIPWGISAHTVTIVALLVALGSASGFMWGTLIGCLIGAGALQLWYVLDHVDGQLARWHGTASIDGTQLDYLMHHLVNLLVPLAIGTGLVVARAEPLWLFAGLLWGGGLLAGGLWHDARYKAFIQRLKWLDGTGTVVGGGGFRPAAPQAFPRPPLRRLSWCLRKSCETHVMLNVLTLIAVGGALSWDRSLNLLAVYAASMCVVAPAVAGLTIVRSVRRGEAEQEFARWFPDAEHLRRQLPDGTSEAQAADLAETITLVPRASDASRQSRAA